jgi:hypothetical protein
MAGHFEVDDAGELSEFSRWSGHYMPEETPGYTSLERVARAAFARFGLPNRQLTPGECLGRESNKG